MLYSVNKDTNADQTLDSSSVFLEAGIHENAELKSVEFKTLDSGTKFIAFYFEDTNGYKMSHTEYEPKQTPGSTDEQYHDKVANQISRIKQIVTKFIPDEEFIIEVDTFDAFGKRVISLLGERYVGKKIRIKVVYSDKGYTTLPRYWKFQFIESMDIPQDKSKIRILSIDNISRPKPNKEETVKNPFTDNTKSPF